MKLLRNEAGADSPLPYLLALPDGYEEAPAGGWPLVLFLHGAGERGADLDKLSLHGLPKELAAGRSFPFVAAAPQCPEESDWYWHMGDAAELLDVLCGRFCIDRSRIYLTGISMGGFGAWELALQLPERFAALAPFCGGGMAWRAWRLAHLPIWAFHGALDDVVPPYLTEHLVEAVRGSGNAAMLTLFPDAGHDCWTAPFAGDALYDWLLAQAGPTPNSKGA